MATEVDDTRWRSIERLYRREVGLLQTGRYEEWLTLFAAELRYRAPIVRVVDHREDVVAKDGELSYYDEDRRTMELRAKKLSTTMSWTEIPPSRLRYFVQLLDAQEDGDGVTATSNFVLFQTRHESNDNVFYGERVDRLVQEDGELRISDRTVVLDRSRLMAENLSVFF